MSPSRSPTWAPSRARPRARLTAMVDLPTPPLPAPTAMMCLTPGRTEGSLRTESLALRDCSLKVIVTRSKFAPCSPATALSACSTLLLIWSFIGRAGLGSSMVMATCPPSTPTDLIIPRLTRSLFRSGSWTLESADRTAASSNGFRGAICGISFLRGGRGSRVRR
jgi:hypothetical protein